MSDFGVFYGIYPRKVGRHAACAVWGRMTDAERAAAIEAVPAHVAYWRACGTAKEFIPHPRTWLHQKRWEDEVEMPNLAPVAVEWWKTEKGVMAKGAELGLQALPGEDLAQYKQRLVDAIVKRRAA